MASSTMKRVRRLTVVAVFAIVAVAAFGFAAANVVPESGAGDGSGDISGYTVSNIEYTLNNANPANVDSVEFDLAPTAGALDATDVRVSVSGSAWSTCSPTGNHWTCTLTGVTAAGAASLQVVAVQ